MSYLKDKMYIGDQNKSGQYYHVKPHQNASINTMIVAEKIIEHVRNLRDK